MPRKFAPPLALVFVIALAAVFALAGNTARTSADPALDPEEQTFVTLINNYRAQNGLGTLTIDWEMQSSSDWMSNDMGVNAYFGHTDSLGRDPWTRMCVFSYCYNTWMGENIAAGYATAADVFTAWKASPGHNANMLGPNYVAMGISRQFVSGSPYGWYWTNDFGGVASGTAAPADGPTTTPKPSPTPSPTPTPVATPAGGDPDQDGFSTSRELFIGTDPNRACGPNDWPPDINGDGIVGLSDVTFYSAFLSPTAPSQPYNARYDLNTDYRISLLDITTFSSFFGKSCVT